jgi:hypothetical protein
LLESPILRATPLQTLALVVEVIAGNGLTVTLTVCAVPGQLPTVEVGVTVYTTVWVEAVVLVRVLLIVAPD